MSEKLGTVAFTDLFAVDEGAVGGSLRFATFHKRVGVDSDCGLATRAMKQE